jgi:hypothetical protein
LKLFLTDLFMIPLEPEAKSFAGSHFHIIEGALNIAHSDHFHRIKGRC